MTKKNKHQKNAEQPGKEEEPSFAITVLSFPSGRVRVQGSNADLGMTQIIRVLSSAIVAVVETFSKKLDDKNLSRIIQLNNTQVAQAKKQFLKN